MIAQYAHGRGILYVEMVSEIRRSYGRDGDLLPVVRWCAWQNDLNLWTVAHPHDATQGEQNSRRVEDKDSTSARTEAHTLKRRLNGRRNERCEVDDRNVVRSKPCNCIA